MAIPANTGRLDRGTETILPYNNSTWADLTTWAAYTRWINDPEPVLTWVTNRLDLGRSSAFNLNITTQAQGQISYRVYTSDTGAFAGEETETQIGATATTVPSFEGRYVIVAVDVTQTSGLAQLERVTVEPATPTYTIKREGVDTSTLAGTVDARQIPLDRALSHIFSITVTAQSTEYTQDVYVTEYPQALTLIPTVVSKSATQPTIRLVGLDNVARDSVIDYELVVMGAQQMFNGNLIST